MSILDISSGSDRTTKGVSPRIGIISKLRRLKIQEDLIIQIIKKNFCEADNDFIVYDLEYKKYLLKLKTSYADIKQLFDDLKSVTKTQETLQKIDLDEVKKDVVKLDEKIKTFKSFIQSELAVLKLSEQHLVKQINEVESNNCAVVTKHTKIATKTYSDIIPSPVRNIIHSPFKYPEVQQLQDFLSSSNKYGGWNEYNHNIFIKLWQKHFQNDEEDCMHDNSLDDTDRNLFINNISEIVAGVRRADIISHMEWYSKYLFLKKQQQLAIEEWRAKTKPKKDFQQQYIEQPSRLQKEKGFSQPFSTRCPKNGTVQKYAVLSTRQNNCKDYISNYSIPKAEHNYCFLVDANEYFKEMEKTHDMKTIMENGQFGNQGFRFTKSTKQWNNRCNSSNSPDKQFDSNNDLDNIIKLGIPNWRSKLIKNT